MKIQKTLTGEGSCRGVFRGVTGGCEQRIEVFVKIQKKNFFFFFFFFLGGGWVWGFGRRVGGVRVDVTEK